MIGPRSVTAGALSSTYGHADHSTLQQQAQLAVQAFRAVRLLIQSRWHLAASRRAQFGEVSGDAVPLKNAVKCASWGSCD